MSLAEVRNKVLGDFDAYTVKKGDTLWSISKSFDMPVNELMQLNGLKDSLIYPNQVLRIM